MSRVGALNPWETKEPVACDNCGEIVNDKLLICNSCNKSVCASCAHPKHISRWSYYPSCTCHACIAKEFLSARECAISQTAVYFWEKIRDNVDKYLAECREVDYHTLCMQSNPCEHHTWVKTQDGFDVYLGPVNSNKLKAVLARLGMPEDRHFN